MIVMRKLMMMCFLSALWLNVFSLDATPDLNAPNGKKGIESTDTTIVKASTPIVSNYSDAETPGEKLDVIYFEILERQISDYVELEAEKTNLEEENRKLKQGTKYKRLEDLQAENDRLSSESKRLTITINEKTDVISILEGYKTENLELQSSEKNLVDNEIKEIFKHEELMSEDLLNFTKNRAIRYQVDQKVISKLSAFMEFSKIVIQAQSLLSNRVNSEELEAQLIILENIKNNEFDFLVIKINSLLILLEEYCDKSTDLFDMLMSVDSSGETDEFLKYTLKDESINFISFPFLYNEITEKINDIKYKSQVQECY